MQIFFFSELLICNVFHLHKQFFLILRSKSNDFFQTQKKIVSDDVLEALEKEEKTERDIKLILDLVQHLPVCFTIKLL